MALSGIQIYKLLPKTNCKDCGFPTCLAFAMKLAAKQVELAACPHVGEEAKSELAESSAPPIRLINVKANGHEVRAGNEVVLFRHEKTFYNKPGFFVRVRDRETPDEIAVKMAAVESFRVNYVGLELRVDGYAVEAVNGDPARFATAVKAVRAAGSRPIILISRDPAMIAAGLEVLRGETPLIYTADADNWQEMAKLAAQSKAALAVASSSLDGLATLTEQLREAGVEDLVLDPATRRFSDAVTQNTLLRRLALKNVRSLGYPIISFPGDATAMDDDSACESMLAVQAIAKYAGFVVLDSYAPELLYPLLVLRENIYTDPQKPIQVQPGLYEINEPGAEDPVLVTTNFSITYFSVANEVEGSGIPAWLLVTDAEGMSVLTAWAAGKFDAERIAKDMKRFEVAQKVNRRRLVLPGHVAVLSGELEEELPGWEIRVGPREAVDIPAFLKKAL
jgi:acetyl-CoA decarbonylase/synthase complex subunit gamma